MSPLDISSSPNQRWLAKEFASSLEQSHRSTRHDVHGYVEFAQHLGEAEGPEPDPAFLGALRHRLLHELIEDELLPRQDELAMRRERAPRRKGGSHCFERAPREPWIAAASTVLIACGGAVGLGADSSQAVPGDTLYPVKRFFESGEMALAGSTSDQARELMEQASERLDEAQQLVTIDEVHAQEALPATIVDFNEATAEAGGLVIETTRSSGANDESRMLISEFRSFNSSSQALLDEIAKSADGETAALIVNARSTLDAIEQQLPILDPLIETAEDLTVASEAVNQLPLGGHEYGGEDVSEPALDLANVTDSVPATADQQTDSTSSQDVIDDTVDSVTGPLDSTTATLEHTVSVVELSTNDTVSMAVATVNNTVKSVDTTVQRTVEAVDKTVQHTTAAVNQTVKHAVDTADQTVKQTTAAVDQTVQQATGTLQQTTGALQSALNAPQAPQAAPKAPAAQDAPTVDKIADDTLNVVKSATSGDLL